MSVRVVLQRASEFAVIDGADLPTVERHKWWLQRDRNNNYAYTVAKIAGKRVSIRMHRLIMGASDGDGLIVDHADGDGLNNQRYNLRMATAAENARNSRTRGNKITGFRGVDMVCVGKFRATIMASGAIHRIGYFADAQKAARAYDDAAVRLHGAFATLNFPASRMLKEAGA